MKTVFYDNNKDNKPKPPFDLTWGQLCEILSQFSEEPDKAKTPAWSPIGVLPGAKRDKKNVTEISCAVFDLDSGGAVSGLEGIAYHEHTSWSHTAEKPKLRIVIPFKDAFENSGKPINAETWGRIYAAIGNSLKIQFDAKCKDPGRIYFLPSYPPNTPEGTEFAITHEGEFLNWRDFANAPTTPASSLVEHDPISNVVDLSEARKVLASTRKAASKELLRKILDGEPLSEKGARDDTLNRAIAIIHWRLPQLPKAAVLELLRPSLAAMMPEEGVESWEKLASDKFDRSVESRGRKIEDDAKEKADLVRELGRLSAASPNAPASVNWRELLDVVEDSSGNRHLRNTARNADQFLRYDEPWAGKFRLNLVTGKFEYTGTAVPNTLSADSLPVAIGVYLDTYAQPGMELRLHPQIIWGLIMVIAEQNAYNPVADYLNGLSHDGVSRLDDMAFTYFNAERWDDLGEDISGYVSMVTRRFMMSGAARALNPGCQADTTLILESPQGYGKSTAFKVLGGDWFSEAPLTAGEKDTALIVAQNWIVELAELDHMNRAKLSAVKAFLTAKDDEYRAPYSRETIKHKRRCVFGGTINPDPGGYLTEEENRRFWPIKVGRIDINALARDRDQLWAEAVSLYKAGFDCEKCKAGPENRCAEHRWWLNAEEAKLAEDQTKQRTKPNDLLDSFLSGWQARPLDRRPRDFNITEALEIAGYSRERVNNGQPEMMGKALKELKLERAPRVHGTTRRYLAGEKLLKLPYLKPNHNYQIETVKPYEN